MLHYSLRTKRQIGGNKMSEAQFIILYLIVGAIIVLGIVWLIKANRRRGVKGERVVAGILRRYARRYHGKVINDLYLPLYDQTTQIDHILIAPFGMIVVETKNYKGEVYGSPDETQWTHIVGDNKHKFYNPVMQNKTHIENIRHIFQKEKVYNVSIENAVVFADKRLVLGIPKGMPVYSAKRFRKHLGDFQYYTDKGVNVERVYDVLKKYQVTDRKLIAQHNKNVKKIAKQK